MWLRCHRWAGGKGKCLIPVQEHAGQQEVRACYRREKELNDLE